MNARDRENLIVECLKTSGDDGLTRPDIVRLTKIPRTTAYDRLDLLETNGKVERFTKEPKTNGAPKVYWRSTRQKEK